MPTCEAAFRNAGMNIGYLNALAATGTARAFIRLENSGDSALAALYFASPSAFPSASGGVSSATGIASDLSAVAGTIAKVGVFNGVSARMFTTGIATSTASAQDFIISTLTLTNGDRIDCTAFTLTAPAT